MPRFSETGGVGGAGDLSLVVPYVASISGLFLTGDEERPGGPLAIARRDLIAADKQSDAALEFEDADDDALLQPCVSGLG